MIKTQPEILNNPVTAVEKMKKSSHIAIAGIAARPTAAEVERRARVAAAQDAPTSVAAEFYRLQELYANSAAVELLMHDNPALDRGDAVDVVATVLENREVFFGRQRAAAPVNGADRSHGNTASLKADFQKLHELIETGFINLERYVKKHGDAVMAGRCLWLLIGFPRLAGAEDLAGLVRLLGRKKQTVNKCLQYFQTEMPELPLLEGQRGAAARANMQQARTDQIPKAGMDLRMKSALTADERR